MIITIPIVEEKLSQHFGHCQYFIFFHIDKDMHIFKTENKIPPPHEPGVLPKWLADEKADVIITGGMGMHAQRLFTQYGVKVVLGAESGDPKNIVESWLNGELVSGDNACDH
ncbi:MAG: NifB/NifX family molybdenum-iron cluster-binding protein [Candidatus Marinimicrobia bacterium]|nr:NifB/NifX family molybdenum-iron cluster-binding protein [Candidatus Neomarinimicrobiota bacterium]